MRKIILLATLLSMIILPATLLAANNQGLLGGVLTACYENGNCTICDIISTAIYIFKWVMGMLGGAALMLFVWYGFSMIISGGNSEKVDKAKTGLVSTLIGLAIVFGSWMIVNVVIIILTDSSKLTTGGTGTIFSGEKVWSDYCKGTK